MRKKSRAESVNGTHLTNFMFFIVILLSFSCCNRISLLICMFK